MRVEIMVDNEQKISQATLNALESELYCDLRPLYPKTAICIHKVEERAVRSVSAVVHGYAA